MNFNRRHLTRSRSARAGIKHLLISASINTLLVAALIVSTPGFAAELRIVGVSADIDSYGVIGEKVVFGASDKLWTSEGSKASTEEIYDFGFLRSTDNFVQLDGKVVFRQGTDLWVTDGTTAGTMIISEGLEGLPFKSGVRLGDVVIQIVVESTSKVALWRTDGTIAGTQKFYEIENSSVLLDNGFGRSQLIRFGDYLGFVLETDDNGEEIWVTQGTAASTQLLKDIIPGEVSSSPKNLTVHGEALYFSAFLVNTGTVLWKSDGSTANTVPVQELGSTFAKKPENLFSDGQTLYFSAVDDEGFNREPWISDGTSIGTALIKDLDNSILSSFPSDFRSAFGKTTFRTVSQTYQTDGTAEGTLPFTEDIRLISEGPNFRGVQYALANFPTLGVELATTDGTELNTTAVSVSSDASKANWPSDFNIVNDQLFFRSNGGLNVLTGVHTIDDVTQTANSNTSAEFELEINSNFATMNIYAICHDIEAEIAPSASDIAAGRINESVSADGSTQLLNHTLVNGRVRLTCDDLPLAAKQYRIFAVFEDASNTDDKSLLLNQAGAIVHTSPVVTNIIQSSATSEDVHFSVDLALAPSAGNIRIYYLCDQTDAELTPQQVRDREIEDGGIPAYSSFVQVLASQFIGNTAQVDLECRFLQGGAEYRIHMVVFETSFATDGLSPVFTSTFVSTLGKIGFFNFNGSHEDSIYFSVGNIASIAESIDLYIVCSDVEPAVLPSNADVKAGRINAVDTATSAAQLLSVNPAGTKSISCNSLEPSKRYFSYITFEENLTPARFAEEHDWNQSLWRTSPVASNLISLNPQARQIGFAGAVTFAAEPVGVKVNWICDTNSTSPTASQIVAGRTASNSIARDSGQVTIPFDSVEDSTNRAFSFLCDGLLAGTQYYAYVVARPDSNWLAKT